MPATFSVTAAGVAVSSEADVREGVIPEGEGSERLDRALARLWPDLSRSRLQALIREGQVTLQDAPIGDPSAKVAGGQRVAVTVPPPRPAEPGPEARDLAVVHEDDDLIVIDKPAGLVVHPGAGNDSGTLVNALLAHCGASLSGIGGVARPGIVHRLDKDTTGLMVVAKTDLAHQDLSAQFADHGRTGPLERAYLALVWGLPDPASGTIDAALARSERNREKIAVVREAALGEREPVGLVRCRLETGRTHQIRVHLAHRGHPLLGDATYGAAFRTKANRLGTEARQALDALGRQALHAALLGFRHPRTGESLRFESPPPADMARLIAALTP
jgi:23S rRNA pseudouridine1911/1915/1917 synthase